MNHSAEHQDIFLSYEKSAKERQNVYKKTLKKVNTSKVLPLLTDFHEKAFQKVDCLQCANCCKNYSPRFKMPDIKRISKYLKIKESKLITDHLYMDHDGDYVLQQTPCPFLNEQNYCNIYDVRPRDCARYPYTNEDVILKQINLTLKNTTVCPATYLVVEQIVTLSEKGK